jgi:hypothetical protein
MPRTKTSVFYQVRVDHAIRGTTRVTWTVRTRFPDPLPWRFRLQVSRNGGGTWENVGIQVVNTFYALDDTPRLYGKDLRITYRVQLITDVDTYYSEPAQPFGWLRKRQWLVAREIIRRHTLEVKQTGLRSLDGYLLKRRVEGTACTCLDHYTGGITDHDCELCHGTGWVDGYWQAIENTMLDLSPELHGTQRDNRLARGTVTDMVARGRFVGIPVLNRRDIWIDKESDRRYYIWNVQNLSEINQVPIIVNAELKLAEATDAIYGVSLAGA